MKLFGMELTRARPVAEQRAMTITQNATREEMLAFFGLDTVNLPAVTVRSAMRVPAFAAGVLFLSRTMATMTYEAFRTTKAGPEKIGGRLQTLVRDAPNPEWSSFGARTYFWQQHFLRGRGLMAIIRQNGQPYELWPMNSAQTRVTMNAWGEKTYTVTTSGAGAGNTVTKSYQAADVIDVPFMLAEDMCNVQSAVQLGEKALQLALAMGDYGSTFFAGGGVPPLAMEGPAASGKEAMNRQMADVHRAIDVARQSEKPVFPMPPGYKLTQVGYDPAKGQMTDARRLQIEEIARVLQLPPVFVGDLTHGTMSNTEQQDVFLVKHRVSQLATALEQEANLKLFGQMNGTRYVRHDVDSLMRGDFLSRMNGLARAVQGSIFTPQEARRFEGKPDHPNPAANELYMQGATVPLGEANKLGGSNNGDGGNDAGTQG